MKSAFITVVVFAVVIGSALVGPAATRAQIPSDAATLAGTPSVPVPSAAPATDPVPAATPSAAEDAAPMDAAADEIVVREESEAPDERGFGHGRGRNVVSVQNRADGQMRFRSRVRLVHIKGDRAEPVNAAFAYSSCADCQSFAVALEIALVSPSASVIAPQNRARAENYACTRCVTVARAIQYVYTVDDPDQVPDNIGRLLREMERELREIGQDRTLTPGQANDRVSAVIAQFQELNSGLRDELAQTEEPTSAGATPDAGTGADSAPSPMSSPSAP